MSALVKVTLSSSFGCLSQSVAFYTCHAIGRHNAIDAKSSHMIMPTSFSPHRVAAPAATNKQTPQFPACVIMSPLLCPPDVCHQVPRLRVSVSCIQCTPLAILGLRRGLGKVCCEFNCHFTAPGYCMHSCPCSAVHQYYLVFYKTWQHRRTPTGLPRRSQANHLVNVQVKRFPVARQTTWIARGQPVHFQKRAGSIPSPCRNILVGTAHNQLCFVVSVPQLLHQWICHCDTLRIMRSFASISAASA